MEVPSIFINRILAEVAKKNAIGLHLTAGNLPLLKIDNQLIEMEGETIVSGELISKMVDTFLSEKEKEKLDKEREIIIVKNFAGNFRFRIDIFFQKDLPSLSFRYIPEVIKNIGDLKLPSVLSNLAKLDSGLFIITGPQLSGKTTTSAAIVEEINRNKRKLIITIEDPIEYLFTNKKSIIEQRQAGRDVMSVLTGVKHTIEKDVDVVFLGEIRNEFKEAAPYILELAAGNSLVLLEVNADSAARALDKILNSMQTKATEEAARYSLADVLVGVIAQKLFPRRGGGLVPACEIVLANAPIKSLIREGKTYQIEGIVQTSRKEGMVIMEKAIEELVRSGDIKQEDVGEEAII
jgi:twitching motility protein PilT